MPLYKKINSGHFEIAIWRLEEELSFFESKFHAHPDISNPNRKLQWYASRYLMYLMSGKDDSIIKDLEGKPSLKNSSRRISLSHTPHFAAAILSEQLPVGIDLEMINPKVERVAHKFLTWDEIFAIRPDEKIRKLILYWSAKESLYKLYGKGGIEFKTQLLVEPFELKQSGVLNAEIIVGNQSDRNTNSVIKDLKIHYDFFEDHVITYVLAGE